jgi:uncharacterized membrane protein YoaK (UPF0700 family)
MKTFLSEIRDTIAPGRDSKYGPLPPLLLAMTVVTGLVDAFSYLTLGHVFVANMTGNVVLMGFALAGAAGFSLAASVTALVSFGVGAIIGGKLASSLGEHRGRLLSTAAGIQAACLSASVALSLASGSPVAAGYRYALIAVLAGSMGIQNAAARHLAVPDITTTVLTMTITGAAADSKIAGGAGSRSGRRLITLVAMLMGAVVGASLVIHVDIAYPLVIALCMIVGVATTAAVAGRSGAPWVHAGK